MFKFTKAVAATSVDSSRLLPGSCDAAGHARARSQRYHGADKVWCLFSFSMLEDTAGSERPEAELLLKPVPAATMFVAHQRGEFARCQSRKQDVQDDSTLCPSASISVFCFRFLSSSRRPSPWKLAAVRSEILTIPSTHTLDSTLQRLG